MLLDLQRSRSGNQPLKACLLYIEGNGGIQQVDVHIRCHCLVCFLHRFLPPILTLMGCAVQPCAAGCVFIMVCRSAMRERAKERGIGKEVVVSISISVCQPVREGQDKWQQNGAGL